MAFDLRRLFFRRRQRNAAARTWIDSQDKPDYVPRFSEWVRDFSRLNEQATATAYTSEWETRLKAKPTVMILSSEIPDHIRNAVIAKAEVLDNFGLIIGGHATRISLSDKHIALLEIRDHAKAELRNCIVRSISSYGSDRSSCELKLIDCWVGSLNLAHRQLAVLQIHRGRIEKISAPLPQEDAPFNGLVEIKNVHLSPTILNAQAFRNLRHHLTAMHNLEAAAIFHGAEMRALYRQQSKLDRAFNLIYRALSNYGDSTTRPAIWFFVFALGNFLLFWLVDGVAVSLEVAKQPYGWQEALVGSDTTSTAFRSAVFTLTQIFNPLGLFGLRSGVLAKSVPLAFASAILCFGATAALGFLFFAIRRRFRLSNN
jgi:hypothetical protein